MEEVKDKSYRSYDYICRYSAFPYYYNNEDKKYIYGTTSLLKKSTSYVIHKVKKQDTLDSLSLYYYHSPLYFWVIADFNNIQDVFAELLPGANIKIPTLNGVTFEEI